MCQTAHITTSQGEALWEGSSTEGPKSPCKRSSSVVGNMGLGLPWHHVTTEMRRCPTASYYREVQSEAKHAATGRGQTRLPFTSGQGQLWGYRNMLSFQSSALNIGKCFLPLHLPAAMSNRNLWGLRSTFQRRHLQGSHPHSIQSNLL